jgi:hypothetical protein
MLRVILAGVAAMGIGTIGGLTLITATPARDAAPPVQLASAITEVVPPSPNNADPVRVDGPKRTADAAPPTPSARHTAS